MKIKYDIQNKYSYNIILGYTITLKKLKLDISRIYNVNKSKEFVIMKCDDLFDHGNNLLRNIP